MSTLTISLLGLPVGLSRLLCAVNLRSLCMQVVLRTSGMLLGDVILLCVSIVERLLGCS